MKLKMHGLESEWTEELRLHADTRLRYALSRYSGKIGLVTVQILPITDARKAVFKTCRIAIRLLPRGRITVEQTQLDIFAALDHAADSAGRAVRRELDRERNNAPGSAFIRRTGGSRL